MLFAQLEQGWREDQLQIILKTGVAGTALVGARLHSNVPMGSGRLLRGPDHGLPKHNRTRL
jgi:hypothetical protein